MKKNIEKHYNLYIKNNGVNKIVKCNSKDLLKNNPKLIVTSNNKEIYRLDNVQSLYLFPLTVIDYINNIEFKNIININIIKIDCNLNYEELFNNKKFKYLKAVEILIKDKYSENEFIKISEIINYFYDKGVSISLNIKNLINVSNVLVDTFKYINYFKIFLPNNLTSNLYNKFLDKLLLIKKLKNKESLVHIKTYLNIKKYMSYEKMINDFYDLNIDIFQVSKELIPIGCENIEVDNDVQNVIRNLEKKYKDYTKIKFISVKDLTTLYYPRFELDERNSKKCYSCYMKPYLYGDKILPCKVKKIFDNLDEWSSSYLEINEYEKVISKCGGQCDDCASIFENDLLYDVETIIKNNVDVNFDLIEE